MYYKHKRNLHSFIIWCSIIVGSIMEYCEPANHFSLFSEDSVLWNSRKPQWRWLRRKPRYLGRCPRQSQSNIYIWRVHTSLWQISVICSTRNKMNFIVKRVHKQKMKMKRMQQCADHFQIAVKQCSAWICIATFSLAFRKCLRQLLKVFLN
jgi:hypothetical protein